MPIFWGYCRISKKDQSKYSLENQEILQRKFCREGYELRIMKEEQSGRNFALRRVLDEILTQCAEGDIVSFTDNSRFGRTTKENIDVADRLREKKVDFLVGNSLVTHDAVGRYRFQIESAASELLSSLQAEKSMAGMITAKTKGEWLYSSRLWGFEHTKHGVQVVESEAEVLRELFERYSKEESLNSITRDLNKRGIRNRKGTPLIVSTVSKMLDNPIYMGYSLPQGIKIPDKDTLIRSEIYKDQIIAPELWWKCWRIRRTIVRPHSVQYEYRWGHYPLGGMIKCPLCKRSYVHNHKRSRGKIYDLYVIGLHTNCPNNTSAVSSKMVEEVVKSIYMLHVLFAKEITEEKKTEIIKSVTVKRKDIEVLERNRDAARKKMASLLERIDFVGDNKLAQEILSADLKRTEKDFNEAETSISRFRSEIENLEGEERELITKFRTDSAVHAMNNQFSELKAQFSQMFSSITLCDKQLLVEADGFLWSCILPISAKKQPETFQVQCSKAGKLRQKYQLRFVDRKDEHDLGKPTTQILTEMMARIPSEQRTESGSRRQSRARKEDSNE